MEKEGIGGSKFDSYLPNFCIQTNFGPVFCIVPVPYGATTLFSIIFRHFQPDLRKKSFRTYIGGEKGHFDERVFANFSKISHPIGIILVPLVDIFDHFSRLQPFLG